MTHIVLCGAGNVGRRETEMAGYSSRREIRRVERIHAAILNISIMAAARG